jgi:hypothetical protein
VQLVYFYPARQSPLQDEAREVLAGLDLAALVADVGPLLVTGSLVSGLMCWRELDVTVLAGSDFSPQDVTGLLARIVRAGVTGLEYYHKRGRRCVTGQVRDERYQVALTVQQGGRIWQIDLTVWLYDLQGMSHAGTKYCASASPPSSAARCCASKTTGTVGRNIRSRSVAWRSAPP